MSKWVSHEGDASIPSDVLDIYVSRWVGVPYLEFRDWPYVTKNQVRLLYVSVAGELRQKWFSKMNDKTDGSAAAYYAISFMTDLYLGF